MCPLNIEVYPYIPRADSLYIMQFTILIKTYIVMGDDGGVRRGVLHIPVESAVLITYIYDTNM